MTICVYSFTLLPSTPWKSKGWRGTSARCFTETIHAFLGIAKLLEIPETTPEEP
jgi:hypothetical protein